MYYKAYKIEIDPNNKQKTLLEQHAGCARFTCNWALTILEQNYQSRKTDEEVFIRERKNVGLPDLTTEELKNYHKELYRRFPHYNAISLHKMLVELKYTEGFYWLQNVSKWAPQNALRNLEDAYKRFFELLKSPEYPKLKAKSKKKNRVFGAPKYKKKREDNSFTLDAPIHIFEDKIQLPKIGRIRPKEKNYIPIGSPKSTTISKKAERWFVSVCYEEKEPKQQEYKEDVIACDLGIKTLAVFSDKEEIQNSKKYKKYQKRLKRQQKQLARQHDFERKKDRKSKSREKVIKKLQITYYKSSCSQKDIINKTTTKLAKTKPEKYVVIEDLNVNGMLKNHNFANSIAHCGFGEFRRQLEYKCELYGKRLILAHRFFPSSKMCSRCGHVRGKLKLSERTYVCEKCGLKIDRDYNASLNLRNYGIKVLSTERSSGIEAGVLQEIEGLKRDGRLHQSSLVSFEVPVCETGTKHKSLQKIL